MCLLVGGGQFNWGISANEVLLFTDTSDLLGPSRYQPALENRGYPYQVFTDEFAFVQAVQNADPASDAVVVDAIGSYHNFTSVATFVQSGGRALLQYWNLAGESGLASAFQASVVQQLITPTPMYDWGGSDFYAGISTPLVLTTLATYDYVHGQKLQPTSGGQAVAGSTSVATANQAGLVIGNSGRTIVHGFFIEEVELTEEAIQFAQNELDFLFGPIAPASAPWIITDPKTQTVLTGGSVTLRVRAGGSLPLSYQWQQGGTNIVGATNALYTLANAQFQHAGSYSVIVSNLHDAAPSGAAVLTVANPAPITNIVLLVDDGTFASPYEDALIGVGLPYQKFSDQSGFGPAVAGADPANMLVIVDSYNSPIRYSELTGFVRAGGRALLQVWNLTPGTHLAEAFNVSVVQRNTIIFFPVYDWGGSGFFAGVSTPLALGPLSPSPSVHGQKLQPTPGAQAVAGFVNSPAANEAALVIGNGGRTLVNGFMLEEAMSSTEATRLAQNEILFFFPLRIESISLSNTTVTLLWTAIPSRNYQVQFKGNLPDTNWFDLGFPVTANGTIATATDTTAAVQRFYRVRLLP